MSFANNTLALLGFTGEMYRCCELTESLYLETDMVRFFYHYSAKNVAKFHQNAIFERNFGKHLSKQKRVIKRAINTSKSVEFKNEFKEKSFLVVTNELITITNERGDYHSYQVPAYQTPDGERKWFINGKLHREDGPAVEHSDGSVEWYLHGIHLNMKPWIITSNN